MDGKGTVVDWLGGRQDLISIRPKLSDVREISLTTSQAQTIFWLSVLVVPGIAIFVGVAGIIRRRRRA